MDQLPEDHFTFATHEIFMSLGLLNALIALAGQEVAALDFDAALQESVIGECLAKRTKMGRKLEEFTGFDELDASVADVEELIDWVKAHTLDFFIRRLTATKAAVEKRASKMKDLESYASGLVTAPSPT